MKAAYVSGYYDVEVEQAVLDENGDPTFDGEGLPITETVTVSVPDGTGPCSGLNRGAGVGEEEVTITPQDLIHGMATPKYKVVDFVFTPLTQAEVDAIDQAAEVIQDARLQRLEDIAVAQDEEKTSKYTVGILEAYLDNEYDPTDFDAFGLAIYNLPDTDMSPAARTALVDMFQEIKRTFGICKKVDRKLGIETLK